MSRVQKQAWYNLAVATLSIIAFLVLLSLMALRPATAAFGLMGLLGLGHLFYRVRPGDTEVVLDERDRLFHARASLLAYRIFWLVWVAGSMGVWLAYRESRLVPVDVVPMTVMGGWVVFVLVQSATTLIQFGGPGHHVAD